MTVPAGRWLYRVPAPVPYWSRRTVRTILGCLARGQVATGSAAARLQRRLATVLSVPDVVVCGSGRTALQLALHAVGGGSGDEVIVPTFCCRSVIAPIRATGAIPVLADVDDDLRLTASTVDAVRGPRTRAVIVPHLFGHPVDMYSIGDLCRRAGIALIDDAAQALGATLDSRPLGTFGDAGIVSFGNGKVCFGTGGGALVANDRRVLERARGVPLATPATGNRARHAVTTLLWRRWRWPLLPLALALSRAGWPAAGRHPYAATSMANLDAAVAETLLDTLAANLRARRQRAQVYRECLGRHDGLRLIQHHPESACLSQIVVVQPGRGEQPRAREVVRVLRSHGYEIGMSYTPLHLMDEYSAYAPRPLPHAERLAPHAVELPCDPHIPLKRVRHIAELVIQACASDAGLVPVTVRR
ncbi:MAG: DegT/DnrJ/EryC1/StrS family aminotransferase [Candidatus Rokuibacteriota bacterium]